MKHLETETLTIGKREYAVFVHRGTAEHPRLKKQRSVVAIQLFAPDGFNIAEGVAYRNPCDRPNPKVGKAVAFKKAVAGLPYRRRIRLLQAFFSKDKTAPGIHAPIRGGAA